MSKFVHLHNHSHYSLLDAACRIDDLVQAAADDGMPAVALTDHGVLFGAIEFYKKAKKAGIKPIIGMEAYIVTKGSRLEKSRRRRNRAASARAIITSCCWQRTRPATGTSSNSARSPTSKVSTTSRGSIRRFSGSTARGSSRSPRAPEGSFRRILPRGGMTKRTKRPEIYKEIFGDDFYIEIQNHGIDRENDRPAEGAAARKGPGTEADLHERRPLPEA